MEYERDELHEMFRQITNIVQPDHSYSNKFRKSIYPIRKEELETTWKRKDSSAWAACGPRYREGLKAKIAFDIEYMNEQSIERILCIINHELTHINEGCHTPGSSHNPAFWNEVVEHAKIILDNKQVVEDIIGEYFNTEEFIEEVILEPNQAMTDGRIETPEERQEIMREQMEEYKIRNNLTISVNLNG